MSLAYVKAAAAARGQAVREAVENRILPLAIRARETWIDPPRVSATVPLVLIAVAIAVVPVALWLKQRQVDAEWRARIAAASASVRAIVESGGDDIAASDDVIIKALGDTDAKLSAAERALRQSSTPLAGDCPVVPRRCLSGGL